MPDAVVTPHPASRAILVAAGALVLALVAATLGLWAHYGSVVFYEMILAGIAACF
jgi:hypothetical protein